jgi:mannose/fructose/N-acetylgalactosamine-specific phosphotransferase system component IIC
MKENMNMGAALALGAVIGGVIGFIFNVTQDNLAFVGAGIAVGIAVILAYKGCR